MTRLTIAAALLLLAACGSGGSTATGSTAAATRAAAPGTTQQSVAQIPGSSNPLNVKVPTYMVTIHVTGAFTQDFQLTSSRSYGEGSCSERAAHGQDPHAPPNQQNFSIPAPSYNPNISIVATIRQYTGPGTYDQDHMPASAITVNNAALFSVGGQMPGTITATVNADGSGSLTFAGAQQVDPGKPALSGSVTWTCADAR